MGPGSALAMLACPGRRNLFSDSNVKQQIHVCYLAAGCARFACRCPSTRREQGMPDARCTRGLVCKGQKEKRTRAYRAAEAIRHSLRNGFTAYAALSPEYRAFLPPSPCGTWHVGPVGLFAPPQDLTPTAEASGPHGFAVRFGTARQHVLGPRTGRKNPPCHPIARTMPPRPPHPIPTFGDDGQRPFLGDRMAGVLKVICPTSKVEFCPSGYFVAATTPAPSWGLIPTGG